MTSSSPSISLQQTLHSIINHRNDVVSVPTSRSSLTFKTSFFGSKPLRLLITPHHANRPLKSRPEPVIKASSTQTFDVVVIGAGIIGLTIARQLLIGSDLSVAVVDKTVPCSGATGAGQGYLWMVHKSPESEKWELAMRSRHLWEMFADSVRDQGLDPVHELGWKKTGSLLVGRTPEEAAMLKERVKILSEAGLRAEFLSSSDLLLEEPELMVGEDGSAAYLPDDCQLDAQRTVAFIEKANRQFRGRYTELYYHPVTNLVRSGSGEVEGVQISGNTLYCNKAVIVASGCWSGALVHNLFKESDIPLDVPVRPRKGHLLVLEKLDSFKLNHGVMEAGYVGHCNVIVDSNRSGSVNPGEELSVSMTATLDTIGNIILGSSRQFAGFNTEVEEYIVSCIWERVGEFFPKLKKLSLTDLTSSGKIRIGLRPYMPDGKPMIGPVSASSNVYISTGHEGEGLSLALGTAEMVADMVLGRPGCVSHAAFAVHRH